MVDRVQDGDSGGGGDQFCPLDSPVDDVWLHVLSFLDDDPRDLMNLADTCVYFQDLVETPRPEGYGAALEVCHLEEVLPFIFKWLGIGWRNKKNVLNLRLVCHRLRNRIDKILENAARVTTHRNFDLFPRLLSPYPLASERQCSFDWDHFRYDHFIHVGVLLNSVARIANYQELLERERFIQTGRRRRGHRIVANTICVDELVSFEMFLGDRSSPEAKLTNNTAFLNRALEFFRAFRHFKIKSVIVRIISNTPLLRTYNLVRNFCEALPHLQSLDIAPAIRYDFTSIPSYTVGEEHELEEFVREHNLPPLPNLEQFSIMFPVPLPFMCQIAEAYGSQLRIIKLDLCDIAFTLQREKSIPEYQFPVLEEIKLRMSDKCIPLIQSIKAPSAKALRLIPVTTYEYSGNSMEDLINVIDNFPSIITLQLNLCLSLEEPRATDSWMKPHQSLRNLAIIASHPLPPLRFFTKWFPNVEWISVKANDDRVREDKDLQLLWGGRFQESSIWREAPTLETVQMRVWDDQKRQTWSRQHGSGVSLGGKY